MQENNLIKYESDLLNKVGNALNITNKLLASGNPQLIPYRKKDKWGFCTYEGLIIIDCIYDSLNLFGNDVSIVELNENYGIINKFGEQITECIYQYICKFYEGLAAARLNWKWGYIDPAGNHKIRFVYDMSEPFINGTAKVFENNKSCQIDKFGNEITPWVEDPIEYEYINNGQKYKHIKTVFIDSDDVLFHISQALGDSDNYIGHPNILIKNGKYGFLNKVNQEIIPCIYDYVLPFNQGISMVELNGKLGYINISGLQYWED